MTSPSPSPQTPSPKRLRGLTRGRLVALLAAVVVCCGIPIAAGKGFLDSNRATAEIVKCDVAGPVARVTFTITNGGLLSGTFDVKVRVHDGNGASIGETTERVPNLHAGATHTRDTAVRYRQGANAKGCDVEIE
ncbi:hypothetical protein [Catellatospora tritici]|uniref:hypothetical protein n=1 Tax=Catellatospora tritici TaxID=2851566 RepID=UPI001C2D49E6|nr:hypothetical protein [Catellatospora tritici]MBV1853063.1 hypothetical protein [Catellatospora tritici]